MFTTKRLSFSGGFCEQTIWVVHCKYTWGDFWGLWVGIPSSCPTWVRRPVWGSSHRAELGSSRDASLLLDFKIFFTKTKLQRIRFLLLKKEYQLADPARRVQLDTLNLLAQGTASEGAGTSSGSSASSSSSKKKRSRTTTDQNEAAGADPALSEVRRGPGKRKATKATQSTRR